LDEKATTCSNTYDSTACLDSVNFAPQLTTDAYLASHGVSGDYTICTNQATCPDSCAECSDTITCTECENGQYLGSSSLCFGCMENCNLCSSDSACTQCSNTYKLETDGSCAKCQYSREYFAECIKCESAGSSLDTCTVCVNSVAHTFTKEIYSTTTYGLIDEENDYVDCLTRCPTGTYPEATFSSNLEHRIFKMYRRLCGFLDFELLRVLVRGR